MFFDRSKVNTTIAVILGCWLCSCQSVDMERLHSQGFLIQVWENERRIIKPQPLPFGNREMRLFDAAERGDLAAIKDALDEGASINSLNGQGEGIMEIALQSNDFEILGYLQSRGGLAYPDAYVAALDHDRYPFLKSLLQGSGQLNGPTRLESTPLIEAIRWGDPDLVRQFLQAGCRPNLADGQNRLPDFFVQLSENLGRFPDPDFHYGQIAEALETHTPVRGNAP